MDAAKTCRIEMVFTDREDRKSKTLFHLPFFTPPNTAFTKGLSVGAALQAASEAVLIGVKVFYSWKESNPGEAGPESNVRSLVGLFYRNESEYEALWLPSPKAIIFENTGAYQGIRVDPTVPELAPFVGPSALVVSAMATPEGTPFPTVYVVGGLVK